MLYLVTSNRFEALTRALFERIEAAPGRSPLEPQTLAVASLAQRRSLTMEFARRHGVAMNLRFVYLAQWLWRAMAARVPGIAAESPFDAASLAWRVDRAFADAAFVQRRPRLAPYLDACNVPMRFAFAQRTARLVEHYTTYRHDWLERWSRGAAVPPPSSITPDSRAHRDWIDDEAWQRALWQRLEGELHLPGEHPARRFVSALEGDGTSGADPRDDLPRAIHVVALPSIAPLHLELLAALARSIDVHVYALNPSHAYWVDVVSERRRAQLEARAPVRTLLAREHDVENDLHFDVGHPLLAAWGAQMQAQHALLQRHVGDGVEEQEAFVEPSGGTRLARMQRAILELDADVTARGAAASGDDDSIEIHVAHSLRRELEALQQRLLARFAHAEAPLQPHEVLLVTPDIDAAAPMIDAVFGAATGDARIAYTITGRTSGDDGGAATALLQLIDLGRGRWSAEDLDAFVHLPLVAQRFGWDADDLATLHDWIGTAGMRFALDADHRRSLGLADDDAWTLDDAIERLLLGHALVSTFAEPDAPPLRAPLGGKLPAMPVSGGQAALLGALASLQQSLRAWRTRLSGAHAPADWQQHLLWAIDTFLAPEQPAEHDGLRALRLALSQWHARLRAADETRELPAELMRLSLDDDLRARAAGAVPTGCVTFASMTGLRRLPYRVVVVFGLNDGAWGASGTPAEWDLMARAPRLGDRQRREDERDVLLDLMLAARDCFWITYTGRDQRGNHVLPPAAVVDEWIEALAAADGTTADALRARIVVEHPLQPFAPELFAPGAPPSRRSHHRGYARALEQRLEAERRTPACTPARAHADDDPDGARAGAPRVADPGGPASANDESANDDLFAGIDSAEGVYNLLTDEAPSARRGPGPGDTADEDEDADDDPGLAGNDQAAVLFVGQLSPVPPHERRIGLSDLKAFFANPAKALLERRLGIALPRASEPLPGDEPFLVDARDRAALAKRLMRAIRDGADDDTLATHALASGHLPPAALGNAIASREIDALRRQARHLPGGHEFAPEPLEIVVPAPDGTWQLVVDKSYLPHDGQACWRTSKFGSKHRLEAWIEHLALGAIVDDTSDARTRLVTRDKVLTLEPLPGDGPAALDPIAELRDLVLLMDQGLREPLPFMPDLSWQALGPMSAPAGAVPGRIRTPNAKSAGERELSDPWLQLAWRGRSLLADPHFLDIAQRVYRTLRAQRPEVDDV